MPRNEAQVRFELIDPALEDRGWNRRTDIRVEETASTIDIVNHRPRRRPKGRIDYVLRRPLNPGTEPIALAILEAKHENRPPEHGMQQGKGYRIGHPITFLLFSPPTAISSSDTMRKRARLRIQSRWRNFPGRKNCCSAIWRRADSIRKRLS